MTDTPFRDLSQFNPITVADILKAKYRVVLARSNDGTYRDPRFQQYLADAKHAADRGELDCFGVYFVLEDNWQQTVETFKSQVGSPHPKMFVVIDLESWGGKITGDHSPMVKAVRNNLIGWLRAHRGPVGKAVDKILGRQHKRVVVYGNVGDLNTLFPHRPRGLHYGVAAYGQNPDFPGKLFHQWSDKFTADGLPSGDINSADGLSPAEFATAVGCRVLGARERIALFRAHRKKGKK